MKRLLDNLQFEVSELDAFRDRHPDDYKDRPAYRDHLASIECAARVLVQHHKERSNG